MLNNDDLIYVKPRTDLVEILRRKGITDRRVLEAIGRVPRHFFVEPALRMYAYEDRPLPIGEGQTISQPFTVAYQTQLLDVKPGMKVLEIGTGSGYQSAVLMELGAKLYTVERIRSLLEETRKRFERLGYRPEFTAHADGYEGLPHFAPFDRIIVTAAAPEIPVNLLRQLTANGKTVIPVGKNTQIMMRIIRQPDNTFVKEVFDRFTFVPMLRGKK